RTQPPTVPGQIGPRPGTRRPDQHRSREYGCVIRSRGVERTGEVLQAAVDLEGGHAVAGAEPGGDIQRGGEVSAGRRPGEDALVAGGLAGGGARPGLGYDAALERWASATARQAAR